MNNNKLEFLPPSLGLLSALSVLHVSANPLVTLPHTLKGLPKLKELQAQNMPHLYEDEPGPTPYPLPPRLDESVADTVECAACGKFGVGGVDAVTINLLAGRRFPLSFVACSVACAEKGALACRREIARSKVAPAQMPTKIEHPDPLASQNVDAANAVNAMPLVAQACLACLGIPA